MKFRLVICVLLSVGFASCGWDFFTRSTLTPDDIQNNYVSLGSLGQWDIVGNPAAWSMVGGVIRCEGGMGDGWLRSKEQYADFSLRLEYKISPGGNSGVFIRCAADGNPWETGYECQISNEQPPRDALHCTGSLYGYVPVNPRPDESPDVWHTYEIVCKNKRIIVIVDGRKTVDVDQDNVDAIKDKPLSGYIGLQDAHSPEGHYVEFRNIQIRVL